MKKLAILFTILILLLFITPGLIGFKAQSRYQDIISELEHAGFEITSNDYQRGWFGSFANTEFKLTLPPDIEAKELTFSMHSDIVHGPLSTEGGFALATIGTSFEFDGNDLFPEEENNVLSTKIGLDGSGKTLISIPALKFTGQPGKPEIQFSGADGEILFDIGFTQLDINVDIPELWVGGPNGESFRVTKIVLDSKSKKGLSDLRLGNGKFEIKQIDFIDPKNDLEVKVDAIRLHGDSSEDGDNITFSANYSISAITVNDTSYGPAELGIEIGNIPAAVAVKIQQGVREIRGKKLPQDQQAMAMMGLLMGVGPEILKADPKLAVNRLYIKTPEGDIEGNLSVAADGLEWNEIGDVRAILDKLNADASIRIPEKLLQSMLEAQARQSVIQHIEMRKKAGESVEMPSDEEIQAMGKTMVKQRLDELLQQGLLVRDGEYVSSAAKLVVGLLSVNGKTIPMRPGG